MLYDDAVLVTNRLLHLVSCCTVKAFAEFCSPHFLESTFVMMVMCWHRLTKVVGPKMLLIMSRNFSWETTVCCP